MRVEMKALEGTDIKNDLWKDKCKELYQISKELEAENDELRMGMKRISVEKTDLLALNEQLKRQSFTQSNKAGDSLDFNSSNTRLQGLPQAVARENTILNRRALVKPLTAKAQV